MWKTRILLNYFICLQNAISFINSLCISRVLLLLKSMLKGKRCFCFLNIFILLSVYQFNNVGQWYDFNFHVSISFLFPILYCSIEICTISISYRRSSMIFTKTISIFFFVFLFILRNLTVIHFINAVRTHLRYLLIINNSHYVITN